MSEPKEVPQEVLFEIDFAKQSVEAIGIPLDATLDKLKVYINGVDVNRTMKIHNLKIVKVL